MTRNVDPIIGEIAAACKVTRARMAARRLTRHYDAALAPIGLKSTEFSVLIAVGMSEDGRLSDIAQMLDFDPSTLTRSLSGLGRKGLVTVQKAGHRTRFAELTAKGKAKIAEGHPLWRKAQARADDIAGG